MPTIFGCKGTEKFSTLQIKAPKILQFSIFNLLQRLTDILFAVDDADLDAEFLVNMLCQMLG